MNEDYGGRPPPAGKGCDHGGDLSASRLRLGVGSTSSNRSPCATSRSLRRSEERYTSAYVKRMAMEASQPAPRRPRPRCAHDDVVAENEKREEEGAWREKARMPPMLRDGAHAGVMSSHEPLWGRFFFINTFLAYTNIFNNQK